MTTTALDVGVGVVNSENTSIQIDLKSVFTIDRKVTSVWWFFYAEK